MPAGASTALLSWSQAAPLRDPCTLAAEAAAAKRQAAAIISLRRAIVFRSSEIMDVCSVFGFTESWEINIFSHVILIVSVTNDYTCIWLDPYSCVSKELEQWEVSQRNHRLLT